MESCEFVEKCPIFALFKHEGAKNIWLHYYCLNRHGDACRRKKLRKEGRSPLEIPRAMLPNGMIMDGPDFSDRTFESRGGEDCRSFQECMPMFNGFGEQEARMFWATRFCFRW